MPVWARAWASINLLQAEFSAKNRVLVVTALVGTAVVAVVGNIERDEHLPPCVEILHRQLVGLTGHGRCAADRKTESDS